MADQKFDKYHYISQYGKTTDLVIHITSYLITHPKASEVPILGTNRQDEMVPKNEALQIVKDYLEEHNIRSEITLLLPNWETIEATTSNELKIISEHLNRQKKEQSTLLASRTELLDNYNHFLETRTQVTNQNPHLKGALTTLKKQIDEHNRQVLCFKQELTSNKSFNRIIPDSEIISPEERRELENKLPRLVPELAAEISANHKHKDIAISQALEKIAKNNPLLTKLYLYNNTQKQQELLANTIEQTTTEVKKNHNISLEDFQKTTQSLTQLPSAKSLLRNRQQLEQGFSQHLTLVGGLDPIEAQKFTTTLLNESVKNAYKTGHQLSTKEILSRTAHKSDISIDRSALAGITENFHPDIEHHQITQINEAQTKGFGKKGGFFRLLPTEVRLAIGTGVDPSIIGINYEKTKNRILKQYNASSLTDLLNLEAQKPTPNFELIEKIQFIENFDYQKSLYKKSLGITHPGRSLLNSWHQTSNFYKNTVSKAHQIKTQAWGKWHDFKNNVNKFNPVHNFYNWRENNIENRLLGYLPIVGDPTRKISNIIYDFKVNTTNSLLDRFSANDTFFGKFGYRAVWLYQRGEYSINGMFTEGFKYGLSKGYHWTKGKVKGWVGKTIAPAAKKVGAWATKQIARLGLEGVATTISNVAAPIVAAGFIAWEVGKAIVNVIKHPEKIAKAAAIVGGIGYAFWKLGLAMLQNFISVAANIFWSTVMGGLGFAFGGPVGGLIGAAFGWNLVPILKSIVPAITSALQAALGILQSTIVGFTANIGGLLVGVITTGTITGLLYTMVLQTSQIPIQEIAGLGETSGSRYIEITKEVTGKFDKPFHIPNNAVDQTIQYKVTIQAIEKTLTNIKITDTLNKITESGQTTIDTQSKSTDTLSPSEKYSFTYTQTLDSGFRDSYITNTVKVTATTTSGEEFKTTSLNISVGTPPVLPAAQFAIRLAQAIDSCYGSTVTMPDGGKCLTNLNDPQISSAVPSLVASANSFKYLQCIGFARAVMEGVGGSLGGKAVAADYAIRAPSGYQLITNVNNRAPLPGDLFVIDKSVVPGTGHIGVVIGISGNLVIVADANSNGKGIARPSAAIPIESIAALLRPQQ